MKKTFFFYVPMWFVWAAWSTVIVTYLPAGTVSAILDSVVVKSLVWVVPFVIFTKLLYPKTLFGSAFPWLACLILFCAVTAFLHTLRLINGLQDTHAVFDLMFIVLSLSAGVIEELSFRGGFYALLEERYGFWPSALINGALFTLYHYPGLLTGEWRGLLSLRGLLIFAMGVAFCGMYRKWRNLALNMAVHACWDMLSFLFCLAG